VIEDFRHETAMQVETAASTVDPTENMDDENVALLRCSLIRNTERLK